MGWSSELLSPLSLLFIEFCRSGACGEDAPALDVGAGYGTATLAALRVGACVIANDIEGAHLESLRNRAAEEGLARLHCKTGRFPRLLHFEPGTLGAIHASSVFHFLTAKQLGEGMKAAARWLRPGGKLFVQAATPYQAPFASFIPEFERRTASGERWPGWLQKASEFCSHRQLSQMPRSIHLLDHQVLRRAAQDAGFQIEAAWLYRREDLPATLHLDGRESVGLVARKPADA